MKIRPTAVPHHALLVGILAALLALGPLTIDLYLPALPQMQHELRTGATAIQLTVTGATIGFGIGQLFVGPMSDSIGRRIPLLAAAVIHVAATLGVAASTDVLVMGVLRFAQGIGCTAASVVAVAIIRDLYVGRQYIRVSANLSAIAGVAPVGATLVGSGLLLFLDWREISLVVAAYGLVGALIVAVVIPETLHPERRHAWGVRSLVARYRLLGRDRRFVGATIVTMMCWSSLFANLTASPFLLQRVHHLSIGAYAGTFGAMTFTTLLSSQLASRVLIPRWGGVRPLFPLSAISLIGAAAIIGVWAIEPSSLIGLIAPLLVVTMSSSAAMACAGIVGITGHRAQAGTAISVQGSLNFIVAGVLTGVVGWLGVESPVGMASVMGCVAMVAMGGSLLLRRVGDPVGMLEA